MINYRISGLKFPIEHTIDDVKQKAYTKLKLKEDEVVSFSIHKKSIDARKKENIQITYSINVKADIKNSRVREDRNVQIIIKTMNYQLPESGNLLLNNRPVVVGSGPAGLFCAYILACKGFKPLVVERGENIEKRKISVDNFWDKAILNEESNVQFGEGGAGTFSDGKLNTGVNDKFGRNRFVLETFVKFGAKENILYDSKPHVGTDILSEVVKNMRTEIIKLGGNFLFESKFENFECINNKLTNILVNDEKINTEVAVLAIGHSARDTFKMLKDSDLDMMQKPFAMGVRIAHNQDEISKSQYGKEYKKLPPADYKLTTKTKLGRPVYSFCMCPGGYVVNASSQKNRLAVNGMSYNNRNSKVANSAIVTTVTTKDLNSTDILAGMYLQEKLESKAFKAGNGLIPTQLFGDLKKHKQSNEFKTVQSATKGGIKFADINCVLPEFMCEAIIEGIDNFGKYIKNFNADDAIVYAVESRTSSPVKILRDENFEANVKGIYPCGEGAGYAGGITSAAIDGIKVAESIVSKYNPDSL